MGGGLATLATAFLQYVLIFRRFEPIWGISGFGSVNVTVIAIVLPRTVGLLVQVQNVSRSSRIVNHFVLKVYRHSLTIQTQTSPQVQ